MSRRAGGPDLVVDAMSARLLGVPATPEAHQWLDGMAAEVAHEHLPRALSAVALPPGHWFLPRLDLEIRCTGLGALPALADQWSRAILDSITASLAADAEWVHFATDTELVAAMVVSAVTGDTTHHWAWVQAGLPESAVGSPPAGVVEAALRLHPEVGAAALVRAAATCGVPALDRALGESGWAAVADALGAVLPSPPDAPTSGSSGSNAPATGGQRAAALLEASSFGRLVLASRLRPSPGTASLWAWLVVAEVEPALLAARRPPVDAVAELVEVRLGTRGLPPAVVENTKGPGRAPRDQGAEEVRRRRGSDDAPQAWAPGRRPQDAIASNTDAAPGVAPHHQVPGAHSSRPEPAAAERMPSPAPPGSATSEPDADAAAAASGTRTRWAGLVYLLATAHETGLPECVEGDAALAVRGVRWSLWRAGIQLTHCGGDDPAVLALCGLAPENAELVLGRPAATTDELRAVARLAARWRRTTLARLWAAPYGGDAVPASAAGAWTWLARRPGEVRATPGWIDVILPLESVDTAVRSAGLDLDPGFVPWLGTVVRLRHE